MHRALRLVLLVGLVLAGPLSFASASAVGAEAPSAAMRPAESFTITDVVTYPVPFKVGFVGPARFAGVTFGGGGSTTIQKWYGTIVRVNGWADRSQLVNGVPYVRMVKGPLATLWVKADPSLTNARGTAPRPPTCRYDDILTSRRSPTKHATTLLDTIYRLGPKYAPTDLRDTSAYGLNGGYRVRAIVGKELAAMAKAARAAGAPLQIVSAYRSYAQQKATFDYWVSVGGYEQALLTSARAGHSEHQLGTTIDFTSKGGAAPWTYADWATTAAGAWMKKHAWKYGFVMTYPKGETASTCYSYESWHYRYVGVGIATVLRETGMTLREAIWAAYGP